MIEKINLVKIHHTLKKGFVYCAFNKINNKVYIGYTQTTLKRRISAHYGASNKNKSNNYFRNALKKYKKNVFEWFIIYESELLETLKDRERYYIVFFKSNNKKFGYNLTDGGEQCHFNEEVCEKISKKAKERNLTGEKNPFFGKTHSEETKKHLSKIRKGIINNPNFKNHTEETKLKLSKIRKELCKDPIIINNMSNSKKNCKPIKCIENKIDYHSIGAAARALNINTGSIKNQLHGRSKTAGGYTFKFI